MRMRGLIIFTLAAILLASECVLGQICQSAKIRKGQMVLDFEDGLKKTGWEIDESSQVQWSITSGKTRSPMTGPEDGAFEGKNYMYMEASFPSQPGYEAILTFKNQFEGCICLEFMCNLWVNKNAKLEVKANGKLIKLIRDTGVGRGRPWEKESITINEPGLTTLQIIGTRGDDFRGDIAIDKLEITPGSCNRDEMIDDDLMPVARELVKGDDAEASGESP